MLQAVESFPKMTAARSQLDPFNAGGGEPGTGAWSKSPISRQPEAATVDVNDVDVVEQPVEDGGGEDLVAGEDLGPVLDVLV